MNLPTIFILTAVAIALVVVLCVMIRRRRRCAPGCAGCPFAEGCHRRKDS